MNINAMKKLINRETSQIGRLIGLCIEGDKYEAAIIIDGEDCCRKFYYPTMERFVADWEDYEEQKEYWTINSSGCPYPNVEGAKEWDEKYKSIGNYFETKEEAEKAVEKLKAWKRLKDRGFKFEGIKEDFTRILQSQEPFRTGKRYLQFNKSEDEEWMKENWEDLDLLFGGEE